METDATTMINPRCHLHRRRYIVSGLPGLITPYHHAQLPYNLYYNHVQLLNIPSPAYLAHPPMTAIPPGSRHSYIHQWIRRQHPRELNNYQNGTENQPPSQSTASHRSNQHSENHPPSQRRASRRSNHHFHFRAEDETLIIDLRGGKIKTALTEETISKHLKTRAFCSSTDQGSKLETLCPDPDEEAEICAICLDEFNENDNVGILHCRHEYHSECIKKWILKKNICPLCNNSALPELCT